jgi:hypothetical protein
MGNIPEVIGLIHRLPLILTYYVCMYPKQHHVDSITTTFVLHNDILCNNVNSNTPRQDKTRHQYIRMLIAWLRENDVISISRY